MEEYIAFDSHKRYTWVEHEQANTGKTRQYRLEHSPGAIVRALAGCTPGTAVALEATPNWYWITDEIEQTGCVPRLVPPRKAKLMMGQINKTNRLDTYGLNTLQRNRTLPTVWIPPGSLRELRELTRTRVVSVTQRTRWKNRITATLAKPGLPGPSTAIPMGRARGGGIGAAPRGIARADAVGHAADAGAIGWSERTDWAVREAPGGTGGGDAGDVTPTPTSDITRYER